MTTSSTTRAVVTIGQRRRVLVARLGWARWLRRARIAAPFSLTMVSGTAEGSRSSTVITGRWAFSAGSPLPE